jgi:ribose transport system substrate-binding protein
MKNPSSSYMVESISRACDVLETFRSDGECLRLSEVASRTGLSKATVFRILYTLERRGLLEQDSDRKYRLRIRPLKRHKYRVGYGAQSTEFPFSRAVCESVKRVAIEEGVELLVLDNKYCAQAAIRNADLFVRERVDLVIEFQTDEHCASIISSKLHDAGIPFIAVDIPHPGATYYGANNYRAGLIGGRYLGKWALQHWNGKVDEVLLLTLPVAGALPHSRLTGALAGLREVLPHLSDSQAVFLNGNGQYERSLEVVRKYLRSLKSHRVLVSTINDPSAMGALHAFEEAGRTNDCAIMGQNASSEARSEIAQSHSRLVGSVAYFPERYGEALIPLAIDIIQGKATPPAIFVKHQLVARENLRRIYPEEDVGLQALEQAVNRLKRSPRVAVLP